jgi:hypothetical protein
VTKPLTDVRIKKAKGKENIMKTQTKNFANPNGHRGLGLGAEQNGNMAPALQNTDLRETQQKAGEELFMKNWTRLQGLPVYITVAVIALATSSCGGSAVTYGATAAGSSSGITSIAAFPTASPSPDSGIAPLTFSFSVNGPGGAVPTYTTGSATLISTDNLLQVEVDAGAAGEAAVPGTNFTGNYNCVSYTVSVYGSNGNLLQSQATGTLAVTPGTSGLCPSALNSVTLNFSGVVSNGTHGGVSVGVVANQYDFYCQMWWAYYYDGSEQFYNDYSYMCPMKGVFSAHTVTGTLKVQTNGTSLN